MAHLAAGSSLAKAIGELINEHSSPSSKSESGTRNAANAYGSNTEGWTQSLGGDAFTGFANKMLQHVSGASNFEAPPGLDQDEAVNFKTLLDASSNAYTNAINALGRSASDTDKQQIMSNIMNKLVKNNPNSLDLVNNVFKSAIKDNSTEVGRNQLYAADSKTKTDYSEKGLPDLTTIDGNKVEFGVAYRTAKNAGLDTFMYKGEPIKVEGYTSKGLSAPQGMDPKEWELRNKPENYVRGREYNATTQPHAYLDSKTRSITPVESTFTPIVPKTIKANGGMVTPKVGQRITFSHGGRTHSGVVKYYNPYNGDFDIA